MSKLTQKMVNSYKERKEWRKNKLPWVWKAENAIISLIAYCEKLIVFLLVTFLSLLLLVFVTASFESFNVQLLIGMAGVVLFAIIAIPKTRRSLILRPEPAKTIDRIIVTFFMGFILFIVGTAGLPESSSSYSSSFNNSSSSTGDRKYPLATAESAREFRMKQEEEKKMVRLNCEQDCSVNKYQYNESCFKACMKAHDY